MKNNSNLSRRRFIGLSAMTYAGMAASSTIGLVSCKKDQIKTATNTDYEAIVIGSGFGGSVAALRLGEAGKKTLLLEMGKRFDTTSGNKPFSPQFFPDTRAAWLKTGNLEMPVKIPFSMSGGKTMGVLDRNKPTTNNSIDIYRGTGLGGGSLVYGAMLPRAIESKWAAHFNDIPYTDMTSKWYPKIESMLTVQTVPDDLYNSQYYQFSRVGRAQAERAGYNIFYIPSGFNFDKIRQEINGEIPKSATNGEMILGVNNGSKKSLDKNYLADAVGTGNVTIKLQHKVEEVRQLSDGTYEINVTHMNDKGEIVEQLTYTCSHLFITAGVVGSMNILLKAKHNSTLPNLDDNLGKGWGSNGNIMVMRSITENTGAVASAAPIIGVSDLNNPIGSLLAEQAPFPLGIEIKTLMYLTIVEFADRGYWQYNPDSQKAELIWDKSKQQTAVNATKHFIDNLNRINGGSVNTLLLSNNGYSNDFTYHPLGGAVRNITSDSYGRLKGYQKLYCIDASQMPGFSCCANPALTIGALAERSMDHILKNDF